MLYFFCCFRNNYACYQCLFMNVAQPDKATLLPSEEKFSGLLRQLFHTGGSEKLRTFAKNAVFFQFR